MARGRVKKTQADTGIEVQTDRVIFALDIGTRSLIGMVGTVDRKSVV